MAGSPFNTGHYQGQILRQAQVTNIFKSVFAAAGRGSSVRSTYNVQAVGPSYTTSIVNTLNTYNASPTGLASPFQLDSVCVAPYINISNDRYPDPSAQATVNPTGGGASGGLLAAGNYYAAYTYIDKLSGLESAVGTSESAQFTVGAGNKPRITFNDSLPSWAASRNVYLTLHGGASGSEVLYATGVTTATFDCTIDNAGSATPPANNRIPSYIWAAAAIAASNANSIANTNNNPGNPYYSNPWTYDAWADYLRHVAKYETLYTGPNGYLTQHYNNLASYNLVSGQTTRPQVIAYEGILQQFVTYPVQTTLNVSPFLNAQLSHDVFYHPSFYYVELAYLQSLQDNHVSLIALESLQQIRVANLSQGSTTIWSYIMWQGQKAGRGDNSDGKGTNLLWLNTGSAQDLNNVSPRLQVWQDWAAAGNGSAQGLLVPFGRSPMVRSPAMHGARGLVMTKANPVPANVVPSSSQRIRKRWFPGISPIRRTS